MLMSTKKSSEFMPPLTTRQKWCISSDSKAFDIGWGTVGLPENLYKNVAEHLSLQGTLNKVGQYLFFSGLGVYRTFL